MIKRRKIVKLNEEISFDVLRVILSYFEPQYLESCRLVCKIWNEFIKKEYNYFYKHLFYNYTNFVYENTRGSWRDVYIHKIKSKFSQTYVPRTGHKNTYLIHDNGGRPFKFEHTRDGIIIYKKKKDKHIDVDEVDLFTWKYETPVCKCDDFIGYWVGYSEFHPFMGNSILIKLTKDTFVFVGKYIYKFEIEDDEMIDYVSPIGNSDVPYPVALGKKYLYFMINKQKVKRKDFKREITFRDGHKIYGEFYGHIKSNKLEKIDMKNVKLIHERL